MFRKLLLLICIAFVVVAYGYPCLIVPFGSYTYKYEEDGVKEEISLQFNFDGTITSTDSDEKSYYKLKGNKIIISEDEDFTDEDLEITLKNIYEFEMPILVSSLEFRNNIGMYATIGVGALAVVLVLTIPSKRK